MCAVKYFIYAIYKTSDFYIYVPMHLCIYIYIHADIKLLIVNTHSLSLLITVNCRFQFFLLTISILTQEFTHSQYKEEPSYSSNKTSKKNRRGGGII